MAQNQYGYRIQPNLLRDYRPAQTPPAPDPQPSQEMEGMISPFPDQTPPGMAYVPVQAWETPYDADTAFPIGTIFQALDLPFRGGGMYA